MDFRSGFTTGSGSDPRAPRGQSSAAHHRHALRALARFRSGRARGKNRGSSGIPSVLREAPEPTDRPMRRLTWARGFGAMAGVDRERASPRPSGGGLFLPLRRASGTEIQRIPPARPASDSPRHPSLANGSNRPFGVRPSDGHQRQGPRSRASAPGPFGSPRRLRRPSTALPCRSRPPTRPMRHRAPGSAGRAPADREACLSCGRRPIGG